MVDFKRTRQTNQLVGMDDPFSVNDPKLGRQLQDIQQNIKSLKSQIDAIKLTATEDATEEYDDSSIVARLRRLGFDVDYLSGKVLMNELDIAKLLSWWLDDHVLFRARYEGGDPLYGKGTISIEPGVISTHECNYWVSPPGTADYSYLDETVFYVKYTPSSENATVVKYYSADRTSWLPEYSFSESAWYVPVLMTVPDAAELGTSYTLYPLHQGIWYPKFVLSYDFAVLPIFDDPVGYNFPDIDTVNCAAGSVYIDYNTVNVDADELEITEDSIVYLDIEPDGDEDYTVAWATTATDTPIVHEDGHLKVEIARVVWHPGGYISNVFQYIKEPLYLGSIVP